MIGLARSTSGKPHVERSTSCAMAFLELHGAKVVVATIFGGEYDTEFQGVDLRKHIKMLAGVNGLDIS